MTERVAAIDCGTNSTRLLVAEKGADGRLVTLDRLMRVTRLGRGVAASGRLEADAIARTIEVLQDYRGIIDRSGASRIRMTATSAARDATNAEEFFVGAEEVIGVRPELISGIEEGRLSFLGATSDLDPGTGPFLVVDIGGGSTEFALGTTACESTMSIDVGCVRMTEQHLHHDPPLAEELSACLSVIELYVDDVIREMPEVTEDPTFVGLAGTVTTTAAVDLGLATYDRDRIHHFGLTRAAIEDVFRTLATEPYDDRITNPGLEPERGDVIVGGLCVLVTVMRKLGFAQCLVSEADILDGLALSLLT